MPLSGFFVRVPFFVRVTVTVLSLPLWLYCCVRDLHSACLLLAGAMMAALTPVRPPAAPRGSAFDGSALRLRLFAFWALFAFVGAGLLSAQYWPVGRQAVAALLTPAAFFVLAFGLCRLRQWPFGLLWLLWVSALSLSFLPILRSQWLPVLVALALGWLWGGLLVLCWRGQCSATQEAEAALLSGLSPWLPAAALLALSVAADALQAERPYWLLMGFVFALGAAAGGQSGRWRWPAVLAGLALAFCVSALHLPAWLLGALLAALALMSVRACWQGSAAALPWLAAVLALQAEYIANLGIPAGHLLLRHGFELLAGAAVAALLSRWRLAPR